MKKLKRLKLTDVVKDSLDPQKLSKIRGGVEIMPFGYGCKSDVCSQNWTGHPCGTKSEICKEYTCTSGVAG